MDRRLQLHQLLKAITPNVYFTPDSNVKMSYPCIVYQRDAAETTHADNDVYSYMKRYQITVIDRNSDSDIPDKVAHLPRTRFDRFFASEQLNHDIFNIFF